MAGTYLVVCEHQIVPQDCPYCELKRIRAERGALERQLAAVDAALGFPHPDGTGRVEMIQELWAGDDWRDAKAQRDELLAVLKDVIATLRQEAPGTPLNNRRFDELGARAYAAIAKAEGK